MKEPALPCHSWVCTANAEDKVSLWRETGKDKSLHLLHRQQQQTIGSRDLSPLFLLEERSPAHVTLKSLVRIAQSLGHRVSGWLIPRACFSCLLPCSGIVLSRHCLQTAGKALTGGLHKSKEFSVEVSGKALSPAVLQIL